MRREQPWWRPRVPDKLAPCQEPAHPSKLPFSTPKAPTSLPSYTARPDRRHGHHPEHVTTQTRRSEPACPQGGHAHLGLRKTNLRAYLPARWRGHPPPWGTPAPVRSFYQHLQLSVAWGGQPMLLFSFKSCSGDSNIQSGRESATCQSVNFSKGISGTRHMIPSS